MSAHSCPGVVSALRLVLRPSCLLRQKLDMSRCALLWYSPPRKNGGGNIDVKRFRSKKQFLGYAGRYARRPPIAQHRFRAISRQEIRFVTKDTRTKRTVETTYTPAESVSPS